MLEILSNALAVPPIRSRAGLIHDIFSIAACVLGMIGVVGIIWLALVMGDVE
jgi:hypothetical protein